MDERLILASASPRRAKLLQAAGYAIEIVKSEVEELVAATPAQTVAGNARAKALAVAAQHPGRWVLGADTEVVDAGRVLGKPLDRQAAAAMLLSLAGRTHEVLTALCLVTPAGELRRGMARCRVTLRALSVEQVLAYHAKVDPLDKAGGYNIAEYGEEIVEKLEGEDSAVEGLPLDLLARLKKS